MNENTKKILDDLRKAGIDTTNLESQLRVNPILDKQADHIIGGGILRQAEFSRYMNETQKKEQELQEQVRNLATMHDAAKTTDLPQAALEAIDKMEKALIATGEYDEDSIKAVSFVGQKALKDRVLTQPTPPISNPPNPARETTMQQTDLTKFVDLDTFQAQMQNNAAGSVLTNLAINAAIDEVKDLGIKVDRKGIEKLQENLIAGFSKGKDLNSIIDETFEVTKVRGEKQTADIEKRIKDAQDQTRAEVMKEMGVPPSRRFNLGRHPLQHHLDRKSPVQTTPPASNGDNKSDEKTDPPKIDITNPNIPKNSRGEVELFRMRGTRDERMQAASELNDKVMEHYANDPTYVE